MKFVECTTQAEMDAALAAGNAADLIKGVFHLITHGTEAPTIRIRASVELTVEARDSSQPRVVARDSSQPRVEAWGSSQPRVEAWGYVQLSLFGRIVAKCSAGVAVLIQGKAEVEGGQQTRVVIDTPQAWCDYYGVSVENGVATLYKAVGDDYKSPKGGDYRPGRIPIADDWDGGKAECGGGLHFSPAPAMARGFNPRASRYVACQVALTDMRSPQDDDGYPAKIKARGCRGPVYEVTEDGDKVVEP
jgi:hypothetical protein